MGLQLCFDLVGQLHQLCQEHGSCIGNHKLSLQIGFHSGPVSGGILGYHRFLYDLFGDTVNLASRAMATSHREDQVHVSEDVFKRLEPFLVDNHVSYERRGPVAIKGKGIVSMYYLQKSQLLERRRFSQSEMQSAVSC